MPVRHLVLFQWSDDLGDDHVAAVTAALAELPAAIPEIREYQFGPDLGIVEGNMSYGVTALFDDDAAFVVYREHPEHQRFIAEHIAGKISARAAVQITVP